MLATNLELLFNNKITEMKLQVSGMQSVCR